MRKHAVRRLSSPGSLEGEGSALERQRLLTEPTLPLSNRAVGESLDMCKFKSCYSPEQGLGFLP